MGHGEFFYFIPNNPADGILHSLPANSGVLVLARRGTKSGLICARTGGGQAGCLFVSLMMRTC